MKKVLSKTIISKFLFASFVFACLGISFPQVADADQINLQPGSEGKDSYVKQGEPDTNFGDNIALRIGCYNSNDNRATFIQFDWSEAEIPPGATIESATLYLYCYNSFGVDQYVDVYELADDWIESGDEGVTWNNFWPWYFYETPCSSRYIDYIGWHSWEVAEHVRDWFTGERTNNGFYVKPRTWNDADQDLFYSSDYNGDPNKRPILAITYSVTLPDLFHDNLVNWNDDIPIGITRLQGSQDHLYEGSYYSNQTLYFNWGSANVGDAVASNYTVRVEVTGEGGEVIEWSNQSTDPDTLTYLDWDQDVGPLAPGEHTFKLWLDCGYNVDESNETNNLYERTITVLAPENQDPVLSNGSVDPTEGFLTTDFTYRVSYTDPDVDDWPEYVKVEIDYTEQGGITEEMHYVSGHPNDPSGAIYEAVVSGSVLGLGNHTFFFECSDGNGGFYNTTEESGPTVLANAPPTVEITYPEDEATIFGTVTVSVEGSDPEDITLTKVEYYLYLNGDFWLAYIDPNPGIQSTWDYNTLDYPEGTNTIKVIGYDSQYETDEDQITVTVDNGAFTPVEKLQAGFDPNSPDEGPVDFDGDYCMYLYDPVTGMSFAIDPYSGDPVNTRNGAFNFTQKDFFIKGRGGLNIEFTRTYNQKEGFKGRFGYGWNYSYNCYYYKDPDTLDVQVLFEDGQRKDFKWNGTGYDAEAFIYDTFRLNGDYYELETPQGVTYRFSQVLPPDNNMGVLTEIEDLNHNKIHLDYTPYDSPYGTIYLLSEIYDDLNRGLTLTYGNGDDNITKIVQHDKDNNEIREKDFTYTNGALTGISEHRIYSGVPEDPPITESFTYDGNNRMVTYTDPRGTVLSNEYDDEGRVIYQYDGPIASENLVYEFQYDDYDPVLLYKETRTISHRSDSETVTTIERFDDKNRLIESIDGENHSSTKIWSDIEEEEGLLLSETDANGNTVAYDYDSQRRKTSTTLPDIEQGEDTIHTVITYAYTDENYPEKVTSQTSTVTVNDAPYSSHITSYQYYPDTGNLWKVIDNLCVFTAEYTYDPYGNVLSVKDARYHTTDFEYYDDGLNKKNKSITVTVPPGHPDFPEGGEQTITTNYTYDSWDNVKSVTNPNGKTTSYAYDSHNNLRQITDALGNTIKYTYDEEDHKITETDQNENTATFTYDTDLSASLIKVEKGQAPEEEPLVTLEYTYDYIGNKISDIHLKDGETVTTAYAYDNANRLESVTEAVGTEVERTTTFEYDAVGNKTKQTDAEGNETDFYYNERNQLKETILPADNGSLVSIYDGFGNIVEVIDPRGNSRAFGFDGLNRLVSESYLIGETSHARTISYDTVGNKTSETDYEGNVTSYDYDETNRLIKTTNADDKISAIYYDAAGNKIKEIDRYTNEADDSHITQYFYDDLNRLARVENALGHDQVSYTHDAAGNKETETDANGNITSFGYDALNRLNSVENALNKITTYEYDAESNRTLVKNAFNYETNYIYDELNRLKSITDALSNETAFEYNKIDKLTKKTDAITHETNYFYDELGRLTNVTDAAGVAIAAYVYDNNGNLSNQAIDGKETTYQYDEANRRTSITYPDSTTRGFGYDGNGNMASKTDGKGQTITYDYDSLNRLTTKTYPGDPPATITYAYDNWDNITEVSDLVGTVTYDYNLLNQPITETRIYTGVGSYPVERSFDDMGNILTITYPDDKVIDYTPLDELNRIDTVKYNGNTLVDYTYDDVGNLTIKNYLNNGVVTTQNYNEINRLTDISTVEDTDTLFCAGYAYDGVGNRTELTKTGGSQVAYAYDQLDRLTGVDYGNDEVTEITYGYDNSGNRQSLTNNLHDFTYSYEPGSNKLSQITVAPNGTIDIAYDSNGSITQEDYSQFGQNSLTVDYAYDYDNQISQVTYNYPARAENLDAPEPNIANFAYDFSGNRIMKQAAGQATYYLNSGTNVLCEIGSDGSVTDDLIYGNGLVARINNDDEIKYFHPDALGSTALITDSSGAVVQKYDYEAFGNLDYAFGNDANKYLFTGQEYDPETNLYYYGARYYNPFSGRFLTKDTARRDLANPQSLNLYVYCLNNPLRWVDPAGLEEEDSVFSDIGYALGYLGEFIDTPGSLFAAGLAWSRSKLNMRRSRKDEYKYFKNDFADLAQLDALMAEDIFTNWKQRVLHGNVDYKSTKASSYVELMESKGVRMEERYRKDQRWLAAESAGFNLLTMWGTGKVLGAVAKGTSGVSKVGKGTQSIGEGATTISEKLLPHLKDYRVAKEIYKDTQMPIFKDMASLAKDAIIYYDLPIAATKFTAGAAQIYSGGKDILEAGMKIVAPAVSSFQDIGIETNVNISGYNVSLSETLDYLDKLP